MNEPKYKIGDTIWFDGFGDPKMGVIIQIKGETVVAIKTYTLTKDEIILKRKETLDDE